MRKYVVLGWTGLCIVGWLVLGFSIEEEADCSYFCLSPGWMFLIVSIEAAVVWIGGLILLVLIAGLVELWGYLRGRR